MVYADKCNHLEQHRERLVQMVRSFPDSNRVRLVGIVWAINDSSASMDPFQVCNHRIVGRGERHQSLRPDFASASHEAVLHRFFKDIQPFDPEVHECDRAFDVIIPIPLSYTPLQMCETVINRLRNFLPLPALDEQQIMEAIEVALAYTPTVFKEQKEPPTPRYFALEPMNFTPSELLAEHFAKVNEPQQHVLYDNLLENSAFEVRPHITLVHKKMLPDLPSRLG